MSNHGKQLSEAILADSAFDMSPAISMGEVLLHVPHASPHMPSFKGYVCPKESIQEEINLLTDWHTDTIFRLDGVATLSCGFSRVFCDVERLPDVQEPMYASGRGFFYTNKDNGQSLREKDPAFAKEVWDTFYAPYHAALELAVSHAIQSNGRCLIVDCHSFPDTPLRTDLITEGSRPDICLGVDDYHTPVWLRNKFVQAFTAAGFVVAVNSPYLGTMVPQGRYQTDHRVISIMVELNRALYLKEDGALDTELSTRVQGVLRGIFA